MLSANRKLPPRPSASRRPKPGSVGGSPAAVERRPRSGAARALAGLVRSIAGCAGRRAPGRSGRRHQHAGDEALRLRGSAEIAPSACARLMRKSSMSFWAGPPSIRQRIALIARSRPVWQAAQVEPDPLAWPAAEGRPVEVERGAREPDRQAVGIEGRMRRVGQEAEAPHVARRRERLPALGLLERQQPGIGEKCRALVGVVPALRWSGRPSPGRCQDPPPAADRAPMFRRMRPAAKRSERWHPPWIRLISATPDNSRAADRGALLPATMHPPDVQVQVRYRSCATSTLAVRRPRAGRAGGLPRPRGRRAGGWCRG